MLGFHRVDICARCTGHVHGLDLAGIHLGDQHEGQMACPYGPDGLSRLAVILDTEAHLAGDAHGVVGHPVLRYLIILLQRVDHGYHSGTRDPFRDCTCVASHVAAEVDDRAVFGVHLPIQYLGLPSLRGADQIADRPRARKHSAADLLTLHSRACSCGTGVDLVPDLEGHLRIGAVIGDHAVIVIQESRFDHHSQGIGANLMPYGRRDDDFRFGITEEITVDYVAAAFLADDAVVINHIVPGVSQVLNPYAFEK